MPITQVQQTGTARCRGQSHSAVKQPRRTRRDSNCRNVAHNDGRQYFFQCGFPAPNRADADNAYTVRFSLTEDIDTNEPNDDAEDATVLDASLCGDSWTEWQEREGTLASPET